MANYTTSPSMIGVNCSWMANGYSGRGNVESLIDSAKGTPAIVCGGAFTFAVDLQEAQRRVHGALIFAVNDVGMFLPRVDHWVSLHAENLAAWKAVRWLHRRDDDEPTRFHAPNPGESVNYVWEGLTPIFALSGYFAMQIAWIMGCRPIVLVGCPGQQMRRFFDVEQRPEFGYGSGPSGSDSGIRQQIVNEMTRLPEFKESVKSMSGWTRAYFGGKMWLPKPNVKNR